MVKFDLKNLIFPNQPKCQVFGTCGGCAYQDISYQKELSLKNNLIKDILSKDLDISKTVFQDIVPSPKMYHYRHRLDLKIINSAQRGQFMGFSPKPGYTYGVVDVETCPIAMKSITKNLPLIRKKAFKRMGDKYRRASLVVRTGDDHSVDWGGIGKGSLKRTPENYLFTKVSDKKIFYSMDTFFQANLSILPEVFRVLRAYPLWSEKTIFYDLYGGVGLFSMAIADYVGEVVLIEENKAAIQCAQYNQKFNKIKNMSIHSGKLEDIWPELSTGSYAKHVAMIDPPRDGLSQEAALMMSKNKNFTDILYLSCFPQALARDLGVFNKEGWHIQCVRPFDFFPRTKHVETLVWLKRQVL